MFFVLSGFLITSLLLKELRLSDRVDFGRFYVHRARRLLPALVVVLLGSAVLALTLAPRRRRAAARRHRRLDVLRDQLVVRGP